MRGTDKSDKGDKMGQATFIDRVTGNGPLTYS